MPALSVLIPVRNARAWIATALRSLWRQSFRDFEVVAVDDGSMDGSAAWLDEEAVREPRLRVIRTEAKGLPLALAAALQASSAPWIARQDADDVSHRRRLEVQMERLRRAGGGLVLGTRVRLFPAAGHGVGMARWCRWHNALLTHEEIVREVLIDSPLAHGTLVASRAVLERAGGWRECGWPEDADLWIRLAESGARFEKLPRVLYGWRQHPESSTRRDARYRREGFLALHLDALSRGRLLAGPLRTVVGTGESLARWRSALTGSGVRVVEADAPDESILRSLHPPLAIVMLSPRARSRWRASMCRIGMSEMRDFIFTR